MVLKFRLLVGALSLLCLFSSSSMSFGYIERHYTLQEVIDSSTNIVFGAVESVDTKRLRAVVRVDEDVMGKSGLTKIKINLAVGQRRPESTPEKMIKYFREKEPVVFFYDKHAGQLNSIGYTGGKWFQCKTFVGEGRGWQDRWWNFVHIEIYMHRTFKGRTDDLQKRVRAILQKTKPILASEPAPEFDRASENYIKILIFSNRKYPAELRTLRKISKIGNYQFAYQITYDPNLPGLEKTDILWFGYRALGEDGYLLNRRAERRIKEFVRNGGVLIVSGQDSEAISTGWFAGKLRGVEEETEMGIHPSKKNGEMFQKPNKIATGNIYTEDSWNGWSKPFTLLATNNRRNVAVGMLKYGKGMYLITSLHHETYFQASSNGRLMENLIYCAAKHLDASTPKVYYASNEPKPQLLEVPPQRQSRTENKSEASLAHAPAPGKANKKAKAKREDRYDELGNKIDKFQQKFSAIQKSIDQLNEISERELDKSLEKEYPRKKDGQPRSTEVPPQQDYYKELDNLLRKLQTKIDLFNREIKGEFSTSKSDLQDIEKRLEEFRQSMGDVKNSFTELANEIEKSAK
ncbi:MAG: hypothetical protein ACE5PV_19590 [Candidatus Poribacteria bacterium]